MNTLKKIKEYLPYIVIAFLVGYVVLLQECDNSTSTKVKTVTKIDSTTVDSLEEEIQYLKSLPPETTKVKVTVPAEPETVYTAPDGTKVKQYTSTYTDSLITAEWTTGLTGSLRYQDFEYSLHHRPVIKRTVTKYQTQYRTTTKTITKQPNPYLSVGLEVGGNQRLFMASPSISWTTSKGNRYWLKYGIMHDAVLIGGEVPIRLKGNSFIF